MQKKKIVLVILVLCYFAGGFTLSRLNIGLNLEVKYILYIGFVFSIIMTKYKIKVIKLNNNRLSLFYIMSIVYLFITMLSIINSTNKLASLGKFSDLLFLIVLITSLLIVLSDFKEEEFFAFLSKIIIVIGFIYIIPIFMSIFAGADRGGFSLGGYNVITRILFFSACCSIYIYTLNKHIKYFVLTILFFIGIILVGSRGGIVGAVCSLSFLWILKWRFKFKRTLTISFRKILIPIMVLVIIGIVYTPLKRVFDSRVIDLMFSGNGVYTAGRDQLYLKAINMIEKKPLVGYGLDGFMINTGNIYPHNIVLEIMIETGIIGLVFFVAMLILSIIYAMKMKRTTLSIFSILPLYMIVVQMFSGSLYDFRYYFFWFIPLLYFSRNLKMRPNKTETLKPI